VIPASDPTAALGKHPRQAPQLPRALPRVLLATAALLAVLSLALVAGWVAFDPQAQALAGIALLSGLGGLGLLRAARMAQLALARSRGLVDEATSLHNHRGLAECGGELLRAARANRRALSLVVLDFDDMVEVRHIYGREVSRRLLARVVRKLETVAGGRGLAARMDGAQFVLVLPGLDRERAQAAVHRALGRPCRVEFDAGDSEIVLVPHVLAETAAPDVETIEELYAELLHNLLEQRATEQRRQQYLQRERERHSRPMGLPAALDSRPPTAVPVAAVDPTLPASLHEEV
jgi:diguanylate cyclase (GGDEF)-like protein